MRETFDELVDRVAGEALTRLVRGDNWRSVIYMVCDQVLIWNEKRRAA